MKYHVVISQRAEKELSDIVDYILEHFQDRFAAQRIYNAITKKISHLALFPKSTPIIKTTNGIEFRITHIKNFAIIYHLDDKARQVKIHSILYAHRNLLELI